MYQEEIKAVKQLLDAFGFPKHVDVEEVRKSLLDKKQLVDIDGSRAYVDEFIKRCARRDPNSIKPLRKRVDAAMNESDQMVLMMDFLVRCRQSHLFRNTGAETQSNGSIGSTVSSQTTPTASVHGTSPFNRRSASRGRVLSTMTGEPSHNLNESFTSRSRANSSFTSYDTRMEPQLAGSQRPRSPYRMGTPSGLIGMHNTRASPLSASNQLFSHNYAPSSTSSTHRGLTPTTHHVTSRHREDSPSNYRQAPPTSQHHMRTSTPTHQIGSSAASISQSIRVQPNPRTNTPLHARLGNAITETESTVCEYLLFALLGMETRLFTSIHRRMTMTSTASISVTHESVCRRVLSIADVYLEISHKENGHETGNVTRALQAAIRHVLGDYIADIDEMRRRKDFKFHLCLPLIDKWQIRLGLVRMAYKYRHSTQMDLLELLYVLHSSFSFDTDRRVVLDKLLDYTMGVFCNQMMEWMTSGEVPADKWMIEKNGEEIVLKRIPIFLSEEDARILLEIGKSLPHVGSASDEDLEAIDKATTVVRSALSPQLIFKKELTPILKILRDVVCGIVMRMVLTTGRLKEHVQKATSFFFLSDPRFTATLYNVIKKASMGLRVGSASLSRQTVSSALASALEATTTTESEKDKRKQKLKFTLDAMTTLGSTPNVSSKMQFVQPLSPHYEPQMDLMKPIFSACDADYEAIFHVIWAIDLARFSTQECATFNLPGIMRFLVKHYSLRENATCLLNMISHVFSVVNATLLRLRCIISVQLKQHLSRFFAAIDEKCVDVDDVIREHQKFVRHVSVVVFVRNNEKLEHELANLLRLAFDAQEFADEFATTWSDVIGATSSDENVRKARIAEICQKRTIAVRMMMDKVNKSHETISKLIDEQITYGNDALID